MNPVEQIQQHRNQTRLIRQHIAHFKAKYGIGFEIYHVVNIVEHGSIATIRVPLLQPPGDGSGPFQPEERRNIVQHAILLMQFEITFHRLIDHF